MKGFSIRKWMLVCLSLFLVFSVVVGCQSGDKPPVSTPVTPSKVKYPITVKDMAGNAVEFKKPAERIISLIPSNTEIAYAIGLGDKMVGGTTNDDFPAEAKKLEKVGDFTINVEKVVALKPDLVLASTMNKEVEKLKSLGIPTLVLDGKSIKEVFESITIVGLATNKAHEADNLVGTMTKEKLAIYQKVTPIAKKNPKKVWLEIDPTLMTAGGDTILNEMLEVAGGVNVAKELKGWPQVGAEKVAAWNPDVIFSTYGSTSQIEARPAWASVGAVKQKQVFTLDSNTTSRPGPRIIEGIKEMATKLYPEAMK
ncbi:ABC transporter substrate-binding protein [Thermoactinomyces sp. DSM 45892]|uniref:ABC transporter substrate-binding protein n=1 Tax=Thermoactinomyces sp. DSM 45892 TaxID=1882753 RepID=UPI0008949318|nr:cobalamin-binding protein [Thermoactinomyces sp. DSM 45892]SDY16418.1 iron complex transport system substrate-binding protein [Thermoactinomyces sp. DSM 45892]